MHTSHHSSDHNRTDFTQTASFVMSNTLPSVRCTALARKSSHKGIIQCVVHVIPIHDAKYNDRSSLHVRYMPCLVGSDDVTSPGSVWDW